MSKKMTDKWLKRIKKIAIFKVNKIKSMFMSGEDMRCSVYYNWRYLGTQYLLIS